MPAIRATLAEITATTLTSGPNAQPVYDEHSRLHVTESGGDRKLTDAGVWAYGDIVVPSDSTDLTNAPARGLYVVVAGDVKFEFLRSDGVTRANVTMTYAAKDKIEFAVYRVYATGTTATVLAGF